MKLTLTLDDELSFTRAGVDMSVDMTQLPKEIVEQLVYHGLPQKVGDAAAGAVRTAYDQMKANDAPEWSALDKDAKAKFASANESDIQAIAKANMNGVLSRLMAGDWGAVRAGNGATTLDRKMVSIIRPAVKKADPDWYAKAEETERFERCVHAIGELSDSQRAELRAEAEFLIKRDAEDKARTQGLDLKIKV